MLFKLSGSENNLPGLDHGPLVPLQVVAGDHQEGEHRQSLDRHLLPHVVFRAGSPHLAHSTMKSLAESSREVYQEGADILGQLALSGGSAVVVLNDLVVERGAHADSTTREVWVEVLKTISCKSHPGIFFSHLSLPELDARWRITVSVQQMVDIILAAVPALGLVKRNQT